MSNYTGPITFPTHQYTIFYITSNTVTCHLATDIKYHIWRNIKTMGDISNFTICMYGRFIIPPDFWIKYFQSRCIWEIFLPGSWWDKVYTNVEWWIMHERTDGVKSDIFQPHSGYQNLNKDCFYQSAIKHKLLKENSVPYGIIPLKHLLIIPY